MERKSARQVNRRDFLKTAAAASAAAAMAGVVRSGYVAESGPLKVGLIGCGGRGTSAARQALRAGEVTGADVQLVALAEVFKDRLDAARKGFEGSKNVKLSDDTCFSGLDAYQKLLASDVNYVILATPPGFRPIHFEAAVNAKKSIFCEKPVGTDSVGIRRFMEAAKKSEEMNLSVVAGTQRHHDRPYVETIKKIHDGEIGDILAARAYWCGGPVFKARERRPEWSDLEWQMRAWYSFCWICGDNIVEQHVHNLDVINWALGSHPVSAFASGGRAWKTNEEYMGNIWDNLSVDYEYRIGDRTVHMMSMSRHWNNCAGANGEAVVGSKGESNCRDKGTPADQQSMVQEHMDLINSITGKGPHLNEAMQVAESSFTAILGREAAYTGGRLRWDDLLKSNLDLLPKELNFEAKNPPAPVPIPGSGPKAQRPKGGGKRAGAKAKA
jgi:predicted dehydrogenase